MTQAHDNMIHAIVMEVAAEVLEVKLLDQGSLKLTSGHRLYSQTLGDWLPAELLQPGESLRTATGTATVAAIIPQNGKTAAPAFSTLK